MRSAFFSIVYCCRKQNISMQMRAIYHCPITRSQPVSVLIAADYSLRVKFLPSGCEGSWQTDPRRVEMILCQRQIKFVLSCCTLLALIYCTRHARRTLGSARRYFSVTFYTPECNIFCCVCGESITLCASVRGERLSLRADISLFTRSNPLFTLTLQWSGKMC